jgi:hypothetical protein
LSLGKIVDDIVPSPILQESWDSFILEMLTNTLVIE